MTPLFGRRHEQVLEQLVMELVVGQSTYPPETPPSARLFLMADIPPRCAEIALPDRRSGNPVRPPPGMMVAAAVVKAKGERITEVHFPFTRDFFSRYGEPFVDIGANIDSLQPTRYALTEEMGDSVVARGTLADVFRYLVTNADALVQRHDLIRQKRDLEKKLATSSKAAERCRGLVKLINEKILKYCESNSKGEFWGISGVTVKGDAVFAVVVEKIAPGRFDVVSRGLPFGAKEFAGMAEAALEYPISEKKLTHGINTILQTANPMTKKGQIEYLGVTIVSVDDTTGEVRAGTVVEHQGRKQGPLVPVGGLKPADVEAWFRS